MMNKTYMFYDNATGEEFFVQTTSKEEAIKTAEEYFKEPKFLERVSEYYAEMQGFDTY